MSTSVAFTGLQGINQILVNINVAQLSIKIYLLFLLNITYIGYSGYYWNIIIVSVNLRTDIYHWVYLNKKSYNWVISKIKLSLFSFKNTDICQNKTIVMKPRQWEFKIVTELFFDRVSFNTTPGFVNTFQIFRTRSENNSNETLWITIKPLYFLI